MAELTGTSSRCVAHPSRPAVDRCPTCDRPRCGADAGPTCVVCRAAVPDRVVRPASARELLVRAALASHVMALVSGFVLQEYVGAPTLYFQYVAPLVAGAAVGAAATASAGEPRGALLRPVRLVAVVYAVLAVGLGFVLDTTYGLVEADRHVLLPYATAALGALGWTHPPRRRLTASEGS